MKKIICIIPAQERNKYSNKGDLCEWGQSTLLDWKISQVKDINLLNEVYVYSSSPKIFIVAKKYKKVKVLNKLKNENLFKMYQRVGKKFKNSLIMWANPTSPFISKEIIINFINFYKSSKFHKDGIVTTEMLKEYFFEENKPLNNFVSKAKFISRNKLKPIYKVTNGLYLSPNEIFLKGVPFGESPIYYSLPWINTLEIANIRKMNLFTTLLYKYLLK
jgi:CMP-N-acetylneuraminic acid synthetase